MNSGFVSPLTAFTATASLVAILGRRFRPRPSRLGPLLTRSTERTQKRRPRSAHLRAISVASAFVVIGALAGPLVGIAMIVVAYLRPRVARARGRRQRDERIARNFPDFVELLVVTIGAGCTPVQAFHELAAHATPVLRPVLVEIDRRVADGARFADAVGHLPTALGPIAQSLADGLALADRYGTPVGPMLDRLASDGRAQRRRNAETAARQLPIRLSFPLVGCTLPSFVLLTIVPLMAGTFSSLQGLRP